MPYTVQVPYQTVENKEKIVHSIVHSVSGTISGGYFLALPPNGIYLNSSKTLKLSWSADGYLSGDCRFASLDETAKNFGGKRLHINRNSIQRFQNRWNCLKYENETRYRAEYIAKEVNSNLYLYSGLVIIEIGALSNIKPRAYRN